MPIGLPPDVLGLTISGDIAETTYYRDRFGRVVAYAKTRPKCPATPAQTAWRAIFATAAASWSAATPYTRWAYEQTTLRRSLPCHGYDLWMHTALTRRYDELQTLARQTGLYLLMPPNPYPPPPSQPSSSSSSSSAPG